MGSNRIQMLTEIALFATLALILDVFTEPMKVGPWISFSFKMIPIFIVAFRWGLGAGLTSGFLWGLLQIATGEAAGGILSPLQGFLEYFVAFALIGFAGLVKPWVDKTEADNRLLARMFYILLGVLLGSTARYLIHFIAGVIFWGHYAPSGTGAIYYSFTVNGLSWLGETLACVLVLWLIQPLLTFFLTKSKR